MSLVSIFLVYLMVWMIVFFMSLPIGINLELGNANSAPTKTHLKLKVLLCTIVSLFPTYLIYWLVKTEYLFFIIQNF